MALTEMTLRASKHSGRAKLPQTNSQKINANTDNVLVAA